MTQMLFCTNRNDFVHEDSFNGEHVTFPPNSRVPLSVAAAEHMFGFRVADKSSTLHRLGWAMKYDPATRSFREDEGALNRLANFIFTEGVFTEKPLEHVIAEEKPAPGATLKSLVGKSISIEEAKALNAGTLHLPRKDPVV